MPIAITRDVSPSIAQCELTHVQRVSIDLDRAQAQHRAYQRTLATLGCRVLSLEAEPDMPDAVFVEDVAVVLDDVAIITRPGAVSRRDECIAVAQLLQRYRPLRGIVAPGTLDGGDVLRVGRTLFVGQSGRSNAAGIQQLTRIAGDVGVAVRAVPIQGCLHLKSAVTAPREDTLLVQPRWIDPSAFPGFRIIEVDPDEEHGANVLRIGDTLLMPDNFPRTRKRLEDAGFAVVTVDVSELQKAEGATTCCSVVFDAGSGEAARGLALPVTRFSAAGE